MSVNACCTSCFETAWESAKRCPSWLVITLLALALIGMFIGIVAFLGEYALLPTAFAGVGPSVLMILSGSILSAVCLFIVCSKQSPKPDPMPTRQLALKEKLAEIKLTYKPSPPTMHIQKFLETKGIEEIVLANPPFALEQERELASKIVAECNLQIQNSKESEIIRRRRITLSPEFFDSYNYPTVRGILNWLHINRVILITHWDTDHGVRLYA